MLFEFDGANVPLITVRFVTGFRYVTALPAFWRVRIRNEEKRDGEEEGRR
jgi:hypothetical protein